MPVKLVERGYISGIIDGEGYLGINRIKRKSNFRGFVYRPTLEIGNVDPQLVEYLSNITGCGFTGGPYSKRSKNRDRSNERPYYKYVVYSRPLRDLLKILLPYLLLKRRQAEIIIEFQSLMDDLYYNRKGNKLRHEDRLTELCGELHRLNKRGV